MHPKQAKLSLKNRALQYLSLREHSRLELGRKLARYAQEHEDVPALLDWLEQARFLSSERFSDTLIRRRSASYGNSRIMAELQTHALAPEIMEQAKTELLESESARARAVWEKKFSSVLPEDGSHTLSPQQRAKQIRFLAQRGFTTNAIRAAMRVAIDELED